MEAEDKKKWTRRSVIGAGTVGVIGGAGVVTAANQTETFEWLFTIFGAANEDVPVTVLQVSTFPPGRGVKEVEILAEAEEDITVDVLVEIEGEREPSDGWPILEDVEFDGFGEDGEQKILEVEFDETYGNVQDNELLITIEETGLEAE